MIKTIIIISKVESPYKKHLSRNSLYNAAQLQNKHKYNFKK